jgi:hypothetical protein
MVELEAEVAHLDRATEQAPEQPGVGRRVDVGQVADGEGAQGVGSGDVRPAQAHLGAAHGAAGGDGEARLPVALGQRDDEQRQPQHGHPAHQQGHVVADETVAGVEHHPFGAEGVVEHLLAAACAGRREPAAEADLSRHALRHVARHVDRAREHHRIDGAHLLVVDPQFHVAALEPLAAAGEAPGTDHPHDAPLDVELDALPDDHDVVDRQRDAPAGQHHQLHLDAARQQGAAQLQARVRVVARVDRQGGGLRGPCQREQGQREPRQPAYGHRRAARSSSAAPATA